MRRLIAVVVMVVLVVAAVGAAWYFVGGGSSGKGWSTDDESAFLEGVHRRIPRATDQQGACILEVYEQYFADFHDFLKTSASSPTLLKAQDAALRRCQR